MNSVKLFRWIFRSENGSPKLLSEFKNDNLNTNFDADVRYLMKVISETCHTHLIQYLHLY